MEHKFLFNSGNGRTEIRWKNNTGSSRYYFDIWQDGKLVYKDARLELQNGDGNVVIYRDGKAEWSSKTFYESEPIPIPGRKGKVKLNNRALQDDDGIFLGFNPTIMPFFSQSDEWINHNLPWVKKAGATSIRALGMVGSNYWKFPAPDLTIDPFSNNYWITVENRIGFLKDMGMRIQLTLFADADVMMPNREDRLTFINDWLDYLKGKEDMVLFLEVANEYWQNGFTLDEVRELSDYLKNETNMIVAPSHPFDEDYVRMHEGGIADLNTAHLPRDPGEMEWRPTRQAWGVANDLDMPFANNEPVGPGSSGNSQTDANKLITDMLNTHVSGGCSYCLHSDPGVRGKNKGWINFIDIPNQAKIQRMFKQARIYLPNDIANWTRYNGNWDGHPFRDGFLDDSQFWTEGSNNGVNRAYAARKGNLFVVVLSAVMNHVDLIASIGDMRFDVGDIDTGRVIEAISLKNGETHRVTGNMETRLVTGVLV